MNAEWYDMFSFFLLFFESFTGENIRQSLLERNMTIHMA